MSLMNVAAVWHSDPNHPFTWMGTLVALIVVIGCGVVLAGVVSGYSTWREAQQPRKGVLSAVLVGGGCFTVVGAVLIAFGVWLYQ
jgi:hypothetical protein